MIFECQECGKEGSMVQLEREEVPQLPEGKYRCPTCQSEEVKVRHQSPGDNGEVPWDCSHTKRERQEMMSRVHRPPWNPNDPTYQAYGHPEDYR